MSVAKRKTLDELLAQRWPSFTVAETWLRQNRIAAADYKLFLGYAEDGGIGLIRYPDETVRKIALQEAVGIYRPNGVAAALAREHEVAVAEAVDAERPHPEAAVIEGAGPPLGAEQVMGEMRSTVTLDRDAYDLPKTAAFLRLPVIRELQWQLEIAEDLARHRRLVVDVMGMNGALLKRFDGRASKAPFRLGDAPAGDDPAAAPDRDAPKAAKAAHKADKGGAGPVLGSFRLPPKGAPMPEHMAVWVQAAQAPGGVSAQRLMELNGGMRLSWIGVFTGLGNRYPEIGKVRSEKRDGVTYYCLDV